VDAAEQLAHEAALAHAVRADHRHQVGPPLGHAPPHRRHQQVELGGPPDERGAFVVDDRRAAYRRLGEPCLDGP
jgi:hypothetical protein